MMHRHGPSRRIGSGARASFPRVSGRAIPDGFLIFWIVLLVAWTAAAPAWGQSARRETRGPAGAAGKLHADLAIAQQRTDRLIVKFREGSQIRLRGASLLSVGNRVQMDAFTAWQSRHPDLTIERHFARPESDLDSDRLAGIARTGLPLADLNLYVQVHLAASQRTPERIKQLLAELRAMDVVEQAFLEPIPEPATLARPDGFRPGAGPARQDIGTPTPDFSRQQGYLSASPSGINAQAVWSHPGGRGAGVKLIDIEGAWYWNHEDLKQPFFTGGAPINDSSWRNHGTAVLGEVVGRNDGLGITGIAHDVQVGAVSIGNMSTAAAIDLAAANLAPGDIFLIELHAPGPNSNGSGQYGYVPMEFWQDNFDAIQTAVANGRICVEAGGNGEQNLDDPVYLGLFDRNVRNSGAILVGAGTPTGLQAEWFTNYGSRIDLNGWGSSVVSTGYGDLQGGSESQWYTAYFSGTSSASPIVVGAVASLQGMSKAHWGIPLNGYLAGHILSQTGSVWVGPKRIGPRPNLVAARELLLQGIGSISGVVRDGESGQPIEDVEILLEEIDVLLRSEDGGAYSVPVMSGSYTLQASDFFHQVYREAVAVGQGQQVEQDIILTPHPAGTLTGTIITQAGAPITGAKVSVVGTPLPSTVSGLAGSYLVNGIPQGTGYRAIYGGVPTRGGAWREFAIDPVTPSVANALLPDATTFENANGAYTGQAPWAWGTPSGQGNPGAFSGTKVWATNLNGNYGDNQNAYLTSAAQNFAGATSLTLSFTHWLDLESGFDGGNVQVKQGSSWTTVEPVGGYPATYLDGLGGEPGFSGRSDGWETVIFDLTPYISDQLQVRFHFGSDGGVNALGWYIDDVAFDTGIMPTAVDPAAPGRSGAPARWVTTWPNPFRESVRIGFHLAEAASIELRLHDPSGRLIRTLATGPHAAGAHQFNWDGRDSAGRRVPSGSYFYSLHVRGREVETAPMTLLR